MAHELFGERFMARRDAAWHGLGIVFDEADTLSATDAFRRIGLDYEIVKIPLAVEFEGETIQTDRYAVIRHGATDPKTGVASGPAYLGTVAEDYTIISNLDLAAHLDPLSAEWPVETAGALQDGATVFLTLRVGTGQIAGEEVREWFLVSDCRDGSEALRISYVTERVVCRNTLTAALNGASFSLSIPHGSTLDADVAFWTEIVPKMKGARTATREALEALAARTLTDEETQAIITHVHVIPAPPKKLQLVADLDTRRLSKAAKAQIADMEVVYERRRDRELKRRLQTVELYTRIGDEHPAIGGTAYALYNAVCEREDHVRPDGDAALASVLWGDRAQRKQRAFNACHDLVLAK